MNHKLIFVLIIIAILAGVFIVFASVANSADLTKKNKIIITLKNEANINVSKNKILEIPQIKIIKIKYRDKEWSRMVNKYDLPNMENPFKNKFIIKTTKKADTNEIFNKIKAMDFVEKIEYVSDTENIEKQK